MYKFYYKMYVNNNEYKYYKKINVLNIEEAYKQFLNYINSRYIKPSKIELIRVERIINNKIYEVKEGE